MRHRLLLIIVFLSIACVSGEGHAEQLVYSFDVKDVKSNAVVLPSESGGLLRTDIDSKLFLQTKLDQKIVNESELLGAFHTEVSVQKLGENQYSSKIQMQFQFNEFKDKPGVSPTASSIVEFEFSSLDMDKIKSDEFKKGVIDQSAKVLINEVFKEADKYNGNYEPEFKEAFAAKITHYTEQLLYKFPNEIEKMVTVYPNNRRRY